MDDAPDIYVDDVMVNASTHGITLTLIRSRPDPGVPVEKIAKPVVGWLRLNEAMASELAAALVTAVSEVRRVQQGTKGTPN